jgi:penicillin amidase
MTAQLDTVTPVWNEMSGIVAGMQPPATAQTAHRLLAGWDGDLAADSAAAAVFVLWLRALERRVAAIKAPRSAEFATGKGFAPPPLNPNNLLTFSRTGHLVGVLRRRPHGWGDWDEILTDTLAGVEAELRTRFGDDPAAWAWGRVRPLRLRHPIGQRRPLDKIFDIGPMPWSGDFSTISQSGAPPLDPLGNPSAIASLRMVVDIGAWDQSRFSLPGGQSGNPASPHYGDQVEPWRTGAGCPMPWSDEAVRRATVESLHLVPGQ